jgi:hypothetical protein
MHPTGLARKQKQRKQHVKEEPDMKNTEEMKNMNSRRLMAYEALLAEKGICTQAIVSKDGKAPKTERK